MKRRIVLLGPPASGKGTQAGMLSKKYRIPAASTGAMLREERIRGTEIGAEADRWTSRGMLFPDDVALRVVRRWLDEGRWDAFILDGFPRTLGQARAFDSELTENGGALDAVFSLDLSREEIRRRVLSRVTCTRCGATFSTLLHGNREGLQCPTCGAALERRNDDTLEALERRLEQHEQHTSPVLEFYRSTSRLLEIDAAGSPAEVFSSLCAILEEVAV